MFTIPSSGTALHPEMEVLHETDVEILAWPHQVVSGCVPSVPGGGRNIDVGSGVVTSGGVHVATAGGSVTLPNNPSTTLKRWDLIYVTAGGAVAYLSGSAAAQPVPPQIPAGGVPIATMYLPPQTETFATASQLLIDKRVQAPPITSVDGQTGEVDLSTVYMSTTAFPIVLGFRLTEEDEAPPAQSTSVAAKTVHVPEGFTLVGVRANCSTPGSADTVIDVHGDGDSTLLGTKCSITAGDTSSLDAAAQPTIVNGVIADDDRVRIYIDSRANDVRGLVVYLYGNGIVSASSSVPTAPQSFQATPVDSEVQLSWLAPVSDGGATISTYEVQHRPVGGAWILNDVGDVLAANVIGLTNGDPYQFQVRALNPNGAGAWSVQLQATPSAGAAGAPDAPTGLAASPGDGQVVLTFSTPADNGSPLTDYIAHFREVGDPWTQFSDPVSVATAITVTGLTNDTTYEFAVQARNALGDSAFSTTVTSTPVAATVPAVPTIVAIPNTLGDPRTEIRQTLLVADDGGSPITDSETAWITDSAWTAAGSDDLPGDPGDPGWTTVNQGLSYGVVVTGGLTPGETYRVTGRLRNAVGWSPWVLPIAAGHVVTLDP